MSENENKYPCNDCEKESWCNQAGKFRDCKAWRKWFHQQWKEIRNLFGAKSAELTLQRKDCDNEDS